MPCPNRPDTQRWLVRGCSQQHPSWAQLPRWWGAAGSAPGSRNLQGLCIYTFIRDSGWTFILQDTQWFQWWHGATHSSVTARRLRVHSACACVLSAASHGPNACIWGVLGNVKSACVQIVLCLCLCRHWESSQQTLVTRRSEGSSSLEMDDRKCVCVLFLWI